MHEDDWPAARRAGSAAPAASARGCRPDVATPPHSRRRLAPWLLHSLRSRPDPRDARGCAGAGCRSVVARPHVRTCGRTAPHPYNGRLATRGPLNDRYQDFGAIKSLSRALSLTTPPSNGLGSAPSAPNAMKHTSVTSRSPRGPVDEGGIVRGELVAGGDDAPELPELANRASGSACVSRRAKCSKRRLADPLRAACRRGTIDTWRRLPRHRPETTPP